MEELRTDRSRTVFLPIALLCLSVSLAGCGGGGGSTSSSATPSAPATSSDPMPAPGGTAPTPGPQSIAGSGSAVNTAPAISGAVGTSAPVNSLYAFTPSADDADGDPLAFQVQNKPLWATFDTQTGRLSGTPTLAHVGTTANIISVSDGTVSTALPAFSITVAQSASGTATLSWMAPTQNIDGSALVNLGGYIIVYGTSPSNLNQTVRVTNPGMTTYMLENLPTGTYYFALKAFNSLNAESAQSNTVSKAIS